MLEQREEGGNNGFVWQLPTRIKYTNVKLTRPIGKDSAKLTAWFAGLANGVKPHDRRRSRAMTADGDDRRQLVPRRRHPGALDRARSLNLDSAQGRDRDPRDRPPRLPARAEWPR